MEFVGSHAIKDYYCCRPDEHCLDAERGLPVQESLERVLPEGVPQPETYYKYREIDFPKGVRMIGDAPCKSGDVVFVKKFLEEKAPVSIEHYYIPGEGYNGKEQWTDVFPCTANKGKEFPPSP